MFMNSFVLVSLAASGCFPGASLPGDEEAAPTADQADDGTAGSVEDTGTEEVPGDTDADTDADSDSDADTDADTDADADTDSDTDSDADADSVPATETCDGVDNDCDGVVDEGCVEDGEPEVDSTDADGDGWSVSIDCDDSNASVYPDAAETCNGTDDDCDGAVDEPDATDAPTWYFDSDDDGYGGATAIVDCNAPSGYVADDGDCNDADADTNPGATDTPYDGTDQDCDGSDAAVPGLVETTITLVGGSGTAAVSVFADDPNQTWDDGGNANLGTVYGEKETEINYHGSVGGHIYIAGDGTSVYLDGMPMVFRSVGDETVYSLVDSVTISYLGETLGCEVAFGVGEPSFVDYLDRGYDYSVFEIGYIDCVVPDGAVDVIDADGDGYTSDKDCDDSDADVNPGATEDGDVCIDGVDNDCDGNIDADAYECMAFVSGNVFYVSAAAFDFICDAGGCYEAAAVYSESDAYVVGESPFGPWDKLQLGNLLEIGADEYYVYDPIAEGASSFESRLSLVSSVSADGSGSVDADDQSDWAWAYYGDWCYDTSAAVCYDNGGYNFSFALKFAGSNLVAAGNM